MAATDAQRALAQRLAPTLYGDTAVQRWFDDYCDDAALAVSSSALPSTRRDEAIVLGALHRMYLANPNAGAVGALTGFGEPAASTRSGSVAHLPPGYPADYYASPYGQRLIGLLSSSSVLTAYAG